MQKTIHRGLFLLTAVIISFVGFTFVHAAGNTAASQDASGDSIVQKDRAEYKNNNFENRFGISFKNHVRVCNDAQSGDANCDARVVADSSGVPLATNTTPSGLSPTKLLTAYGLTGIATTSNRIIGIVDAYDDPNILDDLATYSTTYGIPTLPACSGAIATSSVPCFEQVDQHGTTNLPAKDAGWSLEISLDVEIAHAVCQNCSILLVEAKTSTFTDLAKAVKRAVKLGATVVSNSYGAPEFPSETIYDTYYNHPGVAITASAGDTGYGVQYPAASPYVTAVGGTSLFLNPDGSYNQEAVWSGTGSGCSTLEPKQPWQVDSLCTNRMVADVSADADPNTGVAIYDTVKYSGKKGWFQVGGTSLSSPIIAGVYALSGSTSGSANSIPYSNPLALNDVMSGSNGTCGGTYFCTALAGFDGPTGLGTPRGFAAF